MKTALITSVFVLVNAYGLFIDQKFEWKKVKSLDGKKADEWIDGLTVTEATKTALKLATKLGEKFNEDEDFGKFYDHILKFNKNYGSEAEVAHRFEVIKSSLRDIEKYQHANPEAKYGLTALSDLTKEEFHKHYANLQKKDLEALFPKNKNNRPTNSSKKLLAPDSHDWRAEGKVSGVKDQKQCGSCYAFASVGAIESMHAIRRGDLFDLSVQQAISCSDNSGCGGGNPGTVLQYFVDNGITTWDSFPYTSGDDQQVPPCEPGDSVTQLDGMNQLNGNDEDGLKESIFNNGPIVSTVDASPLQHYEGGIIHYQVGSNNINHAVLTVGYDNENGDDYYLIKNSWGDGFGEGGYFRCGRNQNDMNIALYNCAAYIN
ncbi:unnamed protein product [Bursaphelenchus xylophilus]|uniref:(pine wood nematode) hypothetical protein n=1 Tax=Bursaphelenchus xylophilus TaxID=6326 RepID=A0A1I7S6W0_BURXY|nr:unnamed protein product [Bursaphelenchus xylophilus]CAG9079695.1 unnamed protein product [Bursaphelenchus xylophilus]